MKNTVLLLSLLLFCCTRKKEGCTTSSAVNFDPTAQKSNYSCCYETTETKNVSINGVDQFGGLFAVFQFQQNRITRKKDMNASCPGNSCETILIVKNVTSKTIRFGFNVTFFLNTLSWNYQNSITIPPRSEANIGAINTSCTALEQGTIRITPIGGGVTYL